MYTREFFRLLLDLGEDWNITGVNIDDKYKEVEVKYRGKEYEDPDTEERSKLYDHCKPRRWRHLAILEYKTYHKRPK